MGMFSSYQTKNCTVPNNLVASFPSSVKTCKLEPIDGSKPYEEYDAKGNLVGYFWKYGETLNLEFNITGELTIESDAIIYRGQGEKPSSSTRGYVGQKCYNIIDLISWTCVASVDRLYTWQVDNMFNPMGSKSVYISAKDYLKDKELIFTIYNFRHEKILCNKYVGTDRLIVPITAEISKKLNRGVYYCSLDVVGKDIQTNIFSNTDCILTVK